MKIQLDRTERIVRQRSRESQRTARGPLELLWQEDPFPMLVKTYIYSGCMNTLLSQSIQKCLELENVLAPTYKKV